MPVTNAASGIKAGTVAHFAASTAPAGWLKANGAAVSRTLYAALFTAIGTTYGVGDGATTFNVPDLRGEFMRGLDDGRGVDTGRVIGTAQAASKQSLTTDSRKWIYQAVADANLEAATSANQMGTISSTYSDTSQSIVGANFGQIRPRNVAMLACIKY